MIWKPHVTVAAVVEQDGRFLLVEEEAGGQLVLNQPAGHWEQDESLIQGVVRETLEETGYDFQPSALVGIYRWPHPRKEVTYLRFAFAGHITGFHPERPLDTGIQRPLWLTPTELMAEAARHRSPLVARCVADYLAGRRYPLELLTHFA
ncbi:NUDIX hydrolase [Thiobacter aerophilum]|uniref:Phosphatase NudJ n=1 Tax=Thiobacter aerophilum TaxID=3121275 RepID=A0ABV0EJV4_9BURK